MTWVGLRDAETAIWAPAGLGSDTPAPGADDMPMTRGALVVECRAMPGSARVNLVRMALRDPAPAHLAVCLDPDGSVVILQADGEESRQWRLPVPGLIAGETLVIALQWDVPGRAGMVSVWLPDRPQLLLAPAGPPLPLRRSAAMRLMTDPRQVRLSGETVFVALADRPVPVGPVSGLAGQALVAGPGGARRVADLKAGDHVDLAQGGTARVVWTGAQVLPARGRFRPLFLRAPFWGLRSDLVASPDLHLRMAGADIEYLFGLECVTVAASHLVDQRRVIPATDPLVARYRQVLIDRPGAIVVNGTAVEPFDLAALGTDRTAMAVSAAGRAPLPLALASQGEGLPRLRAYEALTLRGMRAA